VVSVKISHIEAEKAEVEEGREDGKLLKFEVVFDILGSDALI
jgi:hypothetical protein